jgi:hypothetical protein
VRVRAAALAPVLLLAAVAATATAPPAGAQRPPTPPPFAFRTATLVRAEHAIDIRLIAVADVTVTVVITRGTVRLGVGRGRLAHGTTIVPVPIGPRGIKPLREGLHVKVAMYYGPSDPIRAEPALLVGEAEPQPLPMTA